MHPQGENDYWQPKPDQPQPAVSAPERYDDAAHEPPSITWQASEYIHHEKQRAWFFGLFGIAAILLLISIFLVNSFTFALLIMVLTGAVVIFAIRPPRIMEYSLSEHSLQINGKHFPYHDFRAFGIIQDGPLYSALLIPNKRFMPMVTLYFPAENGEEIVDTLGAYMPMEHVELDFMDKLTRKLRF